MRQPKRGWLPFSFIASFFAVGVPYWLIPYNKLNLPSALIEWGLVLVGGSALLLCACKVTSFWKAIRIVGATVPAAVIVRIVVDGFKDPTSHNLWPLELIIALAVGFLCALAGSIAGSLIAKLLAAQDDGGKGDPGQTPTR